MASAEMNALFQALELLTQQVQTMAAQQSQTAAGDRKKWDNLEKYKNVKMFGGDAKEYEEFATKFRSQVAAGDVKVEKMMKLVENECTEERLVQNKYDECSPELDKEDEEFIIRSSSEMYNLLLNMTTGEANAMVRRCQGLGWLAWKKLTSSLNPRTLASGIKAISAALSPGKITQAARADNEIDLWEDRMVKLQTEYGQDVSFKMKVAVLYSMLPKDLQERVLDECAVNWDETPEKEAGVLFSKIKNQIKNIAKSRREMSGPKPMEVDAVMDWADWSDWNQSEETEERDQEKEEEQDEAYVQYIGKGGKKGGKGKGFQGSCYLCGEFGHSQRDCLNMKGKSKGKGKGKTEGYKGYGKDGYYFGSKGKGGDQEQYYYYGGKGKGGDQSRGKGSWMPRACFGCGPTEHLMKDCPKNPSRVQTVVDDSPEVFFIGSVYKEAGKRSRAEDQWKQVPQKNQIGEFMKSEGEKKTPDKIKLGNSFKILQVDEEDEVEEDEVMYIPKVEDQRIVSGSVSEARLRDKNKIKVRTGPKQSEKI